MDVETKLDSGPTRLPRNYKTVYAVLCALGAGDHAAAGEIYVAARKLQPSIGYSTVYRALERLTSLGLVAEVRVPGAQSILYERVRASHAHFLCTSCRMVQDVDFEIPADAVRALSTRHGMRIGKAELTFEGLCRTCAPESLAI